LEILLIQHLRRVVPRLEVLVVTRKVKQAYLRDKFRKASGSVYTTVVVYPDPLSPAPSTASTVKTSENTDPDDPEPVYEGVFFF
jgi:hypothetical protein